MSAPIHRHIRVVERELTTLARTLGPFDYSDVSGWHRRRQAETDAMIERLATETGARFSERYDGARVRLDGIAATSTSGAAAALRNWLKKAKERA